MTGTPSTRPDSNRTHLRLEQLDERIAPSGTRFDVYFAYVKEYIAQWHIWHGKADEKPHGRDVDDVKVDNDRNESGSTSENKSDSGPGAKGTASTGGNETQTSTVTIVLKSNHVVAEPAAEPIDSGTRNSGNEHSNNSNSTGAAPALSAAHLIWLDQMDVGRAPPVAVPGSAALQVSDRRLNVVVTHGSRPATEPPPAIVATEMGGYGAPDVGAGDDPAPSEAVPGASERWELNPWNPPALQAAELAARFVPFDPAAMDESVQRFLDTLNLPALRNSGFSVTRTTVVWAAVFGVGLVAGDFVRRKKLPLKSPNFLTLTKLLTRTKTI